MAQGTRIDGIEHFESKRAICDHVKKIGLPYTVIGTVYSMDNFLDPKRGGAMTFPTLSGTLKKNTKMHMLALDDLGAIATHIITNRERFLGKYIDVESDCLIVSEMMRVYERVSGKTPKSWSLPAWALRLFNKDFAMQLAWQNDLGWSFSLEPSRSMNPALTSFEQFISKHRIQNL